MPLRANWKRRSRRKSLLLAPLIGAAFLTVQASPALAYSGPNAAAYADQWAINDNPYYPSYSSDCTNFVSQAVYAGGYPFRNYQQNITDAWWYYYQQAGNPSYGAVQWESSISWINVVAFYNFLIADSPGGYPEGTAPGSSTNYYTPNSMVTGDVLFFNWGQGEGPMALP
ncbi:MAG TPA: amidase domain-containing protein [Trebonia sp.]|nr:amidase domain-containing protein [Trebonia sp.]